MADPETAPSPQPPPPDSPPQIPQQARPLPILPPEQAQELLLPPQSNSEPSPADKLLAELGGEISPEEFKAKPLPLADNPAAPKEATEVPGGRELKGNPAPTPAPETADQAAWRERLADKINLELNIYNNCFRSVRNMVNQILATSPADSADIGEGQFSGGKRTPIEESEPEIALEVYRQVRQNMRVEEERQRDGELEALQALVQRALGGKGPKGPR
jgi:hypothetical protein